MNILLYLTSEQDINILYIIRRYSRYRYTDKQENVNSKILYSFERKNNNMQNRGHYYLGGKTRPDNSTYRRMSIIKYK